METVNNTSRVAVKAEDQPKKGVHSIDSYALFVPDLSEGEAFYRDFGLRTQKEDNKILLRAECDHVWGYLYEGPKKCLKAITFNCFKENFAEIAQRTRENGDVSDFEMDSGDKFQFKDCDGNPIVVQVGPKRMPSAKPPVIDSSRPEGTTGATYRRDTPPVHPRRLSHILLFSTDVDRSVKFYADTLGLALSDQSESVVAFLHAIHGCDHHLFAFAKSEAPGFHHSSWDVSSISDVGQGAMNMVEAGWEKGWGFGRHVLGSNFFYYVQDPWGSFAEYSCDIDYIPASKNWEGGEHPAEDSLYLWGPDVPEIFFTNYEISQRDS